MRQRDGHYVDDERDKILEAIEQQARSLSQARGSAEEQRLSDWLSAAEDVMPEIKKPAVKPMGLGAKPAQMETARGMSASALMGVVAAGTVAISLAIGGGLAYLQVMDKMSELDATSQQLIQRLSEFEQAFKDVQQSDGEKIVGISSDGQVQAVAAPNHSVSAEFIDARLQAQTNLIAKEKEERFHQLMERLENRLVAMRVEQEKAAKEAQQQPVVVSLPVATPVTEMPLAMTTPVSGAATPAAIAPIVAPTAPSVPEPVVKPVANAPSDTKAEAKEDGKPEDANAWLLEQNPEAFVLQLGSSPKLEGLEPTIKKMKMPESAHLLSIKANGTQRYILVTGSFETREDAKKAADQARIELGITAWMRKVSDVRALLERR
jgi:septal ring-binding cell division protein DamX